MSELSPNTQRLDDFIEALNDLNALPVEVASPFIFEDPVAKVLEYRLVMPGDPDYMGEYSAAHEAVLEFGQEFLYPAEDFDVEPDRTQLLAQLAAFKRACDFPIRWDFSDTAKGIVVYLDRARVLLTDQSVEVFDLSMGCSGMSGF